MAQFLYFIKSVEETILKVTSLFQYGLIFWKWLILFISLHIILGTT